MTRLIACISVMLSLCSYSSADQNSDIIALVSSLNQDIQSAQQKLSKSERNIAQKTASMYQSLHKKQVAISQLRVQAALIKRQSDEQTLGLNTLQTRLKKWQDQHQYQTYLLLDYAEKIAVSPQQKTALKHNMNSAMAFINEAIANNHRQLSPTWHTQKIVLPEGKVETASIINLGPVTWFWQQEQRRGGLAKRDKSSSAEQILYKTTLLFNGKAHQALANLYATQQGHIYIDPTLERAQKIASQKESLLQHIKKGGLWVTPILLFALVAIIIALIKALQLWRLPKLQNLLHERIISLNNGAEASQALHDFQANLHGAEANILAIVLDTSVSQQRDERLFACLLETKHRLESWLGAIAITAAVSPLLGLLGTVSGMIETFKMMTIFGAGDPAVVSGGISQALITTEMGLVVAIPALLLHALLSRYIHTYNTLLETTAIKLGQLNITENAL